MLVGEVPPPCRLLTWKLFRSVIVLCLLLSEFPWARMRLACSVAAAALARMMMLISVGMSTESHLDSEERTSDELFVAAMVVLPQALRTGSPVGAM